MSTLKKIALLIFASLCLQNSQAQETTKTEISFNSTDGITVYGDLYLIGDKEAPFIILFHQAGYSRGEYIETAPKFNKLGYNCLAIDARSGKTVNEVDNKTAAQAKEKGLETKYPDAMPDLEAAIKYVKEEHKPEDIVLIGSSYSSCLAIILASNTLGISSVLAFSPGEYFTYKGKKIQDYAKEVRCPVFITSAKSEITRWEKIFANLPETLAFSFKPSVQGKHGSRALWEKNVGHETYWEAVEEFLKQL